MTDSDGDGLYEVDVPAGYPSVIFCRMNPTATANNWNNKWNQTADLTVPTDGTNLYTVKNGTWDKGGGTWSTHTPAAEEETNAPGGETTTPAGGDTTDETITVYFRNEWLWPEVYVNYWNESQGSTWPGDLMTKVGTDSNFDVYSAEVPTWATTLVFNGLKNGDESIRQQTPNVTDFADGDTTDHWETDPRNGWQQNGNSAFLISENSYNASDFVNHIEWSNLEKDTYANNSAYYKGLIEFRKAHEALRLETSADITANVKYTWITNEVVMFTIDGTNVEDEISDAIVVIFNANKSAKTVALPDGDWSVCVNGTQAGTEVLSTATGSVSVDGISAMVLVQGATEAPEEEEPDVTATIAQKGRNLEYKDMIYVIDIFELKGVEGIDLTTDAGILVWSQEEYAALNGNIVYDEAHAKPGLESYPAKPEFYFGKSDGIFTRDLYKTAWYAGYVKLPDGTYVYSEAKEYGPETYAYKMLTSGSEKTKTLCVALLNYISAAQKYFDPSTPDSELVNYELTAEQKALTWDNPELNLAATEIPAGKDVTRDKTVFKGRGKNLLFEEMISLVSVYVIDTATVNAAQECGTIFWTAEQFEALTEAPSVENYGEGTKVVGYNVYQSTDGQWYSAAPAVAPKDMAETEYYILGYVIDADGNVHYSGVMSYTFEQYIANMAANANMGEFAKRLYYYERAVKDALG